MTPILNELKILKLSLKTIIEQIELDKKYYSHKFLRLIES